MPCGHDQGPGLREQDAEHDALAGPYPGQFLPAFVAAGEPVPRGRDEMLGDPELIVVLWLPGAHGRLRPGCGYPPSSASCCAGSPGCSAAGEVAYKVVLLTVVTAPTATTR